MIANKIKLLREQNKLTQAYLARKLGITRSSVNAWEMGISVPSTQYLVELSKLFDVSTDYLLGLSKTSTINLHGLEDEDIILIHTLVNRLRNKKQHS